MSETNWTLYLIEASDNSLYCGITNNLERRFEQHKTGKGAKYFRGRTPVAIAYQCTNLSHSIAAKLEVAVKRLTKTKKSALITNNFDYPALCVFLNFTPVHLQDDVN